MPTWQTMWFVGHTWSVLCDFGCSICLFATHQISTCMSLERYPKWSIALRQQCLRTTKSSLVSVLKGIGWSFCSFSLNHDATGKQLGKKHHSTLQNPGNHHSSKNFIGSFKCPIEPTPCYNSCQISRADEMNQINHPISKDLAFPFLMREKQLVATLGRVAWFRYMLSDFWRI